MVDEIAKYKCSICNEIYDNVEDANRCESKGIIPIHPIGTIFSMYDKKEMIFAIIEQHPNTYGHHHTYSTWACRDTKSGDNCGGEDFCGLESWDTIFPPNKKIPAYKRMVGTLRIADINPIDYKKEAQENES